MKQVKNCFSVIILCLSITFGDVTLAEEVDSEQLFPGNKQRHLREAAKYRFEFDNDVFFGSDNQFSNGWSFQVHTPVAKSWRDIEGPAEYMKEFGAWLPSLTSDGLWYRMSFAIGQIIQTPDDLNNPDPSTNDVPYAGLMAMQGTWLAYNDSEFRGFEISLGIVGRPSMAEQTQNLVHKLIGSQIAQGWDSQLNTEPAFNLNYMRKMKFYQAGIPSKFSFDAAISGDIELGTMITAAGVRLETRFGSNLPLGFAYHPDAIGRFMTYDATLAPPKSNQSSVYVSFSISGSAIAHNILVDGNVFRDSPSHVESIDKESFVAAAFLGFHYERPSWGVHLDFVVTTDVVDTSTVTASPDPDNSFSTLMIEWRI